MKSDINSILEFLPHRYPFILIDRVIELIADKKIIALKNITINEPFFQGHFPKTPIMPGVLILESIAQAGMLLCVSRIKEGDVLYLSGMDKVRFRKPVVPGDQLIIEVKMLKLRKRSCKVAGTAAVKEKIVAQAEIMGTFGEKP